MAQKKRCQNGVIRDLFGDAPQASRPPQRDKTRKSIDVTGSRSAKAGQATGFLTVEQVAKRFGVSRATVWRWVKSVPDFPEPVKLSAGTSRWTEEQLRKFEHHAETRSVDKAQTSGFKVRKGVAK